jgi:hypothetical protein
MKPSALTLIRPMAAAIVHGSKRIENRPRDLPRAMRGVPTVVAVHAGEKYRTDYETTCDLIDGTPSGRGIRIVPYQSRVNDRGIVGLMRLTGRVYTTPQPPDGVGSHHVHPSYLDTHTRSSPAAWFSGPFGYEIDLAAAFPEPIPCRGMQGWWPVPKAAIAEMRRQVETYGAPDDLADLYYQFVDEEPRTWGGRPLHQVSPEQRESEFHR